MYRVKSSWISLFIIIIVFWGFSATGRAQENNLKKILQSAFDLSSQCKIGDKNYYHIRTVYLDMNDSGMVAKTSVLDGYYSREVIRIDDANRYDRFLWKYVKTGQRQGKGEIQEYEILPYTKWFQYEFCLEDWEPEHFPVDLTTIPKTMEGWTFVVKLIDTHTFDSIMDLKGYDKTLQYIGDNAKLPAENIPVNIDFPPLFTDTYFINNLLWKNFKGITLYKGDPCAILFFRTDDCRVHLTVNMMDMKLPTDGVSYYWGDIYFSLRTKRIVWGQIIERVDSITSMVQMGAPMKHVTRREITLEEISKEIYESL